METIASPMETILRNCLYWMEVMEENFASDLSNEKKDGPRFEAERTARYLRMLKSDIRATRRALKGLL